MKHIYVHLVKPISMRPLLALAYFIPSLAPLFFLHLASFPFVADEYQNFLMLSMVFALLVPAVIFNIKRRHWSLRDIGLDFSNFKKAAFFYGKWALIGLLLFCIVAAIQKPIRTNVDSETIILYSVCGSVLQECLYRGYLMKVGKLLFQNNTVNCIANVAVFVAIHSIFGDTSREKLLVMAMVLPAAILFTFLYHRYASLVLISVAHIISNVLGVYSGIFN